MQELHFMEHLEIKFCNTSVMWPCKVASKSQVLLWGFIIRTAEVCQVSDALWDSCYIVQRKLQVQFPFLEECSIAAWTKDALRKAVISARLSSTQARWSIQAGGSTTSVMSNTHLPRTRWWCPSRLQILQRWSRARGSHKECVSS
jgi:hypothetical protein